VGLAATAAALRLAYVSEVLIGAWCLFCIAAWTISGGLLVCGVVATRRTGWRAAIAADLSALLATPRASVAAAGAGLLTLALLVSFYPHYWDHARAAEPPAGASGPSGPAVGTRPGAAGAIVFSDYECPYCAIAHAELKATLTARPDIVVQKRHFPLDAACNPVLKGRPMHQHACEYARAAVCAEAQGRFDAMDDGLFGNQQARAPLDEVARGAGLDLGTLHACMDSSETQARVAGDIAAGVAVGLKATPTYVVGGQLYPARFPLELFAPPADAAASTAGVAPPTR
jgi:protein-disulfide isomerase